MMRTQDVMEDSVRKLFERYERLFNQALGGDIDVREVASLYAACFIAANPTGVMTGRNNDQLKQMMAQGYARYRAIGTKAMRIREIRVSPLDELHAVVQVAWTGTYVRKDERTVTIDFDVTYFVRTVDGRSKVFGWVSGDEQALLSQHGIV